MAIDWAEEDNEHRQTQEDKIESSDLTDAFVYLEIFM